MKLASYNVENLFLRAVAMNGATFDVGKDALKQHAELNAILGKAVYTAADKTRIVKLMKDLKIDKKDDGGPFVLLRQNRGHLIKRPQGGGLQVVANGRADWIGWVELKREEVNEVATRNTARVINDVNADILGVVEAESRPALVRFSDNVIAAGGGTRYAHAMLIDGNDERGIDVAVFTRAGYDIVSIQSHVDDMDATGRIFSRDCAVYEISTPQGNNVFVLVNHFKSKGFGSQADSNAKRKRQAKRVKEIYQALRAQHPNVAVLGDLNDTPDSDPLSPLIAETDLKDISQHAQFDDGGRPGNANGSTASNRDRLCAAVAGAVRGDNRGRHFPNGRLGRHQRHAVPALSGNDQGRGRPHDHAAIWARSTSSAFRRGLEVPAMTYCASS
jgi:endonuclease/exonuclease/phosphatase family metal-dependent hydrolase